ncbi:MAG: tetratricopeptide repeat protein [Ignavibacteriaceae bacterium]|nr:tetratricopeptide repeat protein [Ignavibacteriaceae bacterium]
MLNKLIEEIKERKIRKWITIHLSTGLSILGVSNLLSSRYNFPSYIFDLILVITVFGLISVVILAWFHGKEDHQKVTPREIVLHSSVVICAAIGFVFYISRPKLELATIEANSIAVLPFENMSSSKEDEYFSDGVTEDILTQLSKIEKLKVVSRTSVMQYKNTTKSVREIGKELGVETILEGSVRRFGDRVRIVGQLIDAKNDRHLWAETYDRELKDIFLIQTEVATKIAASLKTELTSRDKEKLKWNPTKNVNAYGFYLEGREHYNRYKSNENDKAITLFRKALELDPDYALAYTGLADAFAQKSGIFGSDAVWYDSSITMSNKAITLNPNLAEAYKSIGVVYAYQGKFHSAIEYYSKALELNPNFGAAINNIGSMYWWLGKYDEAYPWAVKSIQVDPARASGYSTLGLIYIGLALDSAAEKWFLTSIELQPILNREENLVKSYITVRNYQKARNYIQSVLKESPAETGIYEVAGFVELFAGDLQKAKLYYDSAYIKNPDKKNYSPEYAYILWKYNKKKEAEVIFHNAITEAEEYIKQGNEEFNSPYALAQANAVLGNKDLAYKWLQQAINNGWRQYELSSIDPLFENIRNEDRFKQMMNDLKQLVYSMRNKIDSYK